jgi:hypothetical protein
MALDQSALLELAEMVQRADGGDLMRKLLEAMLQSLVDAQATAHIGAEPHERSDARTTQRNGHRPKTVTTASGDVTIKIPKTRTGSFFPSLLEPRRRIDVAGGLSCCSVCVVDLCRHRVALRQGAVAARVHLGQRCHSRDWHGGGALVVLLSGRASEPCQPMASVYSMRHAPHRCRRGLASGTALSRSTASGGLRRATYLDRGRASPAV